MGQTSSTFTTRFRAINDGAQNAIVALYQECGFKSINELKSLVKTYMDTKRGEAIGRCLDSCIAAAILPLLRQHGASEVVQRNPVRFLHVYLEKPSTFKVRPKLLRKPGFSTALRGARKLRGVFDGQGGNVAAIPSSFPAAMLQRKLVVGFEVQDKQPFSNL